MYARLWRVYFAESTTLIIVVFNIRFSTWKRDLKINQHLVERKGWFYSCSIWVIKRIVNFLHLDCTWQNGKWRQLLINIHYSVIKWWSEENFSLVCNLFFKKHCIFMKSHNQLPFYFGEHWIFKRSRFHLPYYFGEHCIFMRSCLYLPFYFGELCIFMRNCLHFVMYNQGEENVTILFITQIEHE